MKFRKFLSLYFFTIKDFTPVNVFKRIKYSENLQINLKIVRGLEKILFFVLGTIIKQ